MPTWTRRAALASIGSLAVAGCLAGPEPGDPTDGPATGQPASEIASPADMTTDVHGITPAANRPEPDHAIYLANEGGQDQAVRVRVVRQATGAVVFDESLTISAGAEREVYNLKEASPDGIESFAICGQLVGVTATTTANDPSETPDSTHRDCITLQTSECYGTAHIAVQDSGELQVIYAVC